MNRDLYNGDAKNLNYRHLDFLHRPHPSAAAARRAPARRAAPWAPGAARRARAGRARAEPWRSSYSASSRQASTRLRWFSARATISRMKAAASGVHDACETKLTSNARISMSARSAAAPRKWPRRARSSTRPCRDRRRPPSHADRRPGCRASGSTGSSWRESVHGRGARARRPRRTRSTRRTPAPRFTTRLRAAPVPARREALITARYLAASQSSERIFSRPWNRRPIRTFCITPTAMIERQQGEVGRGPPRKAQVDGGRAQKDGDRDGRGPRAPEPRGVGVEGSCAESEA